jgi:hypothetical protein
VQRIRVFSLVIVAAFASCNRAAKTGSPAESEVVRPLAAFAAQRMVVMPTARVRAADSLGWVKGLGGVEPAARKLDTSIVAVLDERGLASRWILPAELVRSYERNRTYAADPYQLAIEQVRPSSFKAGGRYGDPLSSQLRTLIALHENARFVFMPIELRFEREGAGGHAVVRVALLDPRSAEARWVAEVKGSAASTPALALVNVARSLADLFVAP